MDEIHFVETTTSVYDIIKKKIASNTGKIGIYDYDFCHWLQCREYGVPQDSYTKCSFHVSGRIVLGRQGDDDAFFVVDLRDILFKYSQWQSMLPGITPFYAVKCNDDKKVLELMAMMGMSFDCASKNEIEMILSLDVPPTRIIYTNPHKQISHLQYARDHGIDILVFDCEEELSKIRKYFPSARLLLRSLPSSGFKVGTDLGKKFGCKINEACMLLEKAKDYGQSVIGVCFHVGWACTEVEAYKHAIQQAKSILTFGQELGHRMKILDIGGGFIGKPSLFHLFKADQVKEGGITKGNNRPTACNTASITIKETIENCPLDSIEIVAEPGTYFVESAFTLAVNIIGKRKVRGLKNEVMTSYYLNDGAFGSFGKSRSDTDYALTPPVLITNESRFNPNKLHPCILWGPTCDSLDQIVGNIFLPDLDVGQWLAFPDMGAYTIATKTMFNGMTPPKCVYICDDKSPFMM